MDHEEFAFLASPEFPNQKRVKSSSAWIPEEGAFPPVLLVYDEVEAVELAFGSTCLFPGFLRKNAVKFSGDDQFLPRAKPVKYGHTYYVCADAPKDHSCYKHEESGRGNHSHGQQHEINSRGDTDEQYTRDAYHAFGFDPALINSSHERLSLLKRNVCLKAGGVGAFRNGFCRDFERASVVAFKVEYGKKRQVRTGSFVSIGLFKAARIELLEMKEFFWRFRTQNFALFTFFFQRKRWRIVLPVTVAGRQ